MTGAVHSLLAIELSGEMCSIAVSGAAGGAQQRGRQREFVGERGRALIGEIDALLHDAGLAPAELRGVVVGTGPGSYTGLRIACAAARALSFALDLPVAGACSFAAAALAAPAGRAVHVVIDAFRGEIYHAVYLRPAGGGLAELVAPRVLKLEAAPRVPADAWVLGTPELRAAISQSAGGADYLPSAAALLELARLRGGLERLDAPDPLYLRTAALRRAAPAPPR